MDPEVSSLTLLVVFVLSFIPTPVATVSMLCCEPEVAPLFGS